MNPVKEYEAYQRKIGDRRAVYETVAQAFQVKRALYPGSHIDLAPSIAIPHVTYVDSFKGAIRFFKQIEEVKPLIERQKIYGEPCTILFFGQDYYKELDIEPVDLIISEYAGFVGQATKRYLKPGGVLLCNDSHGDATLARFDEDYDLIGVIRRDEKIVRSGLDQYFQQADGSPVDIEKVKTTMKGPTYKKRAAHYLFQKRNSIHRMEEA